MRFFSFIYAVCACLLGHCVKRVFLSGSHGQRNLKATALCNSTECSGNNQGERVQIWQKNRVEVCQCMEAQEDPTQTGNFQAT